MNHPTKEEPQGTRSAVEAAIELSRRRTNATWEEKAQSKDGLVIEPWTVREDTSHLREPADPRGDLVHG